ncbi:type II toxin-antitoxin system RelB family antitoxin [Secundilactobacillus mixtipabuli]|uniref:Antitoxin n=1 Tax=Secundilactobacillus mixtipabuli TaxID=1435342 RepID=A0A1Z5IEI8_9LACO|nr:DUF6290 family protein [Secundilactobacillus mixtipabuli]GAX00068.1 hypothetical protein IWT30_02048 [Secundilactobacillus mixtipabuli]
MAMITVRVSDSEKKWLQCMADFYGITLSDLIKKFSMEQLEDKYDKQVAQVAFKRYQESGKETHSMEEVFRQFGGTDEDL